MCAKADEGERRNLRQIVDLLWMSIEGLKLLIEKNILFRVGAKQNSELTPTKIIFLCTCMRSLQGNAQKYLCQEAAEKKAVKQFFFMMKVNSLKMSFDKARNFAHTMSFPNVFDPRKFI